MTKIYKITFDEKNEKKILEEINRRLQAGGYLNANGKQAEILELPFDWFEDAENEMGELQSCEDFIDIETEYKDKSGSHFFFHPNFYKDLEITSEILED